jgi:pilus assembly protein CpaB
MISLAPLIEKRGIIIAVVVALIAAFLAVAWLNQQQRQLSSDLRAQYERMHANTVEAIYARTDIPQGKVIIEDMLYTKPVTKDSLPAGAVVSLARVIDRVATVTIKKDAMINTEMVGWPITPDTTLAMKTPIGKRAITISVDNISSLVGMIKPGDYVDVISSIAFPVVVDGKQSTQPAMVPLFQNVPVLAVGSQIGTDAAAKKQRDDVAASKRESAPLITLALTPEEANLLAFVQEQGKIRLVLRSPGDARTQTAQPANWETLLKYLYPDLDMFKPAETKKEPPRVEVIRGFKKEMVPLGQRNQ